MGSNSTVTDQLRAGLYNRLGVNTKYIQPGDYTNIKESEWSQPFEKLMRERLIMGAFRYGTMARKKKIDYDNAGSVLERINLYIEDGNLEHLVDIANICMIEFVTGAHPKRHFNSLAEHNHHTQVKEGD
ncbi:MAG: hypothetical protein KAJ03_09325 [Gammaproteobacteria bacterium]|nr:hypothetical protein [Gammaproteobacteria bacterium]